MLTARHVASTGAGAGTLCGYLDAIWFFLLLISVHLFEITQSLALCVQAEALQNRLAERG